MSWLVRWRMRRAAKQYARRLGPHLRRAYGGSEHYTVAQIGTAVGKLGLNADFIALGLAAHLSEEDFAAMAPQMPINIPYDEARELVARFRPAGLRFEDPNYYESGTGMTGGLDGGSS